MEPHSPSTPPPPADSLFRGQSFRRAVEKLDRLAWTGTDSIRLAARPGTGSRTLLRHVQTWSHWDDSISVQIVDAIAIDVDVRLEPLTPSEMGRWADWAVDFGVIPLVRRPVGVVLAAWHHQTSGRIGPLMSRLRRDAPEHQDSRSAMRASS